MKQKKQWRYGLFALVCAAVLLAVGLCGCQTQEQVPEQELQPIVVGCDDYEPYSYIETSGDYSGVDVELAKEAFHRMGYEPEFRLIPWEKRDALLQSGEVECLWSCFTMTGRESQYRWAGPYLYSRHVVMVRADSGIWTLADLAGRRVGVQSTTKPESVFLQRTDPRVPQVGQLYSCSDMEELQAMLRKGYVEAIASHEENLEEMARQKEDYRVLEECLYTSELGVAFESGTHQEMAAQLTRTLSEMKQDGTMDRIVRKYGLDPRKVVWGGDVS